MDVKISSIQPASDVRKKLFDILFSLENNLEEAVVVTLKNKPQAVIISYELFDSLMETLDVLSDRELVKQIDKSLKSKDFVPFDQILREEGYQISDVKRKYGISTQSRPKRKKILKKIR